jgi:pentapeptide MXKDX repeat protein
MLPNGYLFLDAAGTFHGLRRIRAVVSHLEAYMRKVILAAMCVAFVGGLSAASAQAATPADQGMMKTTNPMDAQDKMMKKKKMKKGMMKSDDGMGMKKNDGMMKDGMKKDGMSK